MLWRGYNRYILLTRNAPRATLFPVALLNGEPVSQKLIGVVTCAAQLLLLCAHLAAQSDAPDPLHIGSVTVSGLVHERYEDWDFFQGAKGQNSYGYSGSFLRLMFSQTNQNVEWAAPILLSIPNQAVQPSPLGQLGLGAAYYAANHSSQNAAGAFLKQAFVRVKGSHSSLRLG